MSFHYPFTAHWRGASSHKIPNDTKNNIHKELPENHQCPINKSPENQQSSFFTHTRIIFSTQNLPQLYQRISQHHFRL